MTFRPGHRQKKAIFLDGTSDYLSVTPTGTGAANINPNGDEAFSVSAWVRPQNNFTASTLTKTHPIFNRHRTTGSWAGLYFRLFEDGTVNFSFSTDYGGASNGVDAKSGAGAWYGQINEWGLYVATYDGSETSAGCYVYQNGVDVSETRGTTGTPANMSDGTGTAGNSAAIGAYSNGWGSSTTRLEGGICGVGFWSAALTPAQVEELYFQNAALPSPGKISDHSAYSSLVAYWIGDDPSDTSSTIQDTKGSNNMASTSLTSGQLFAVKT